MSFPRSRDRDRNSCSSDFFGGVFEGEGRKKARTPGKKVGSAGDQLQLMHREKSGAQITPQHSVHLEARRLAFASFPHS